MTSLNPAPSGTTRSVEIVFFGAIADAFGRRLTLPIPAEGLRLQALRRRLCTIGGDRILCDSLQVAVDQTLIRGEATVRPGQEVAIMSPFSGG